MQNKAQMKDTTKRSEYFDSDDMFVLFLVFVVCMMVFEMVDDVKKWVKK